MSGGTWTAEETVRNALAQGRRDLNEARAASKNGLHHYASAALELAGRSAKTALTHAPEGTDEWTAAYVLSREIEDARAGR